MSDSKAKPVVESSHSAYDRANFYMLFGGYLFLGVSACSLIGLIGIIAYQETFPRYRQMDEKSVDTAFALLTSHFSSLLLLFSSVLAAIVGHTLLKSGGAAFREVIPPQDSELLYDLIRRENSTGLDNYVRLASLTGFVGACHKIGITGLPLATIGLTGFFALLGLVPGTASQGFLDLSKLTLGAFIGSYVQKTRSTLDKPAPDSSPIKT